MSHLALTFGTPLPLLGAAALAVAALACPAAGAEISGLEVTDLWDYPRNLGSVVAGGTTLVFMCDPAVKECREGAVFIETRKPDIREAGARLVLLFRGDPAELRSAVLGMDLDSEIYIDEEGRVIDAVLDQDILPAILLIAPDGTVLRSAYGGGESLAGNIDQVLRRESPEPPGPPPAQVAQAEEQGSNRWKWVVGALAAMAIGAVILLAD